MHPTITDNKLFNNHVSPHLCENLKYAGFKPKCKYFWKVYEMAVILDTHVFDTDEYYRDGNKALDQMVPLKNKLPAFTIKEIEDQLPDFCVCKTNGKYEISMNDQYGVEAITADRLPDAFALIMLAAIRKRVIDVNKLKAC
jgi:hypothetical protein